MQTKTYSHIPGLSFVPGFFSDQESRALVESSLALHQALEAAHDPQQLKTTSIPQPEFVADEQDTISARESFARVAIDDGDKKLGCEYFPAYGERGHALAYFRGNVNIPGFIQAHAQQALWRWLIEQELFEPSAQPSWRMTLNIYQRIDDQIAGFPFHVDIPVNGTVTTIMNVHREALFQIIHRDQDTPTDITLPIGSLLVLSGPSRYEWKHRVLPAKSQGPSGEVARVSLVLGVR